MEAGAKWIGASLEGAGRVVEEVEKSELEKRAERRDSQPRDWTPVRLPRKGAKSADEFWSKVLSAPKVKRILERQGISPEGFRREYEADTSRSARRPRIPTRQQIDAVEAFQRSGDFEHLKQALGTRSSAVANSALRRVLQYKAQGGVKTIRRRSASAGA